MLRLISKSHPSNPRQFTSPRVHSAFSGCPGELKSRAFLIWLPWEFQRALGTTCPPILSTPSLHPPSLPPFPAFLPGCAQLSPSLPFRGPQLRPPGRHPRPPGPEGRRGEEGRAGGGELRGVEAKPGGWRLHLLEGGFWLLGNGLPESREAESRAAAS